MLYSHGARKFWIHGTGALGCLPQKLAFPRDDDTDLDAHGCLNTYNKAARRFNALLSEACGHLRRRMVDAAIVVVDMYAIKYDLVANHTMHGTYVRTYVISRCNCNLKSLLTVLIRVMHAC